MGVAQEDDLTRDLLSAGTEAERDIVGAPEAGQGSYLLGCVSRMRRKP